MKRIFKYPFLGIMIGVISIVFIISVIKKDTAFSEMENRNLMLKPKLSVKGLLDGSFEEDYDTYTNEQLPWRTQLISLKALSEKALGKIENNGVVQGEDQILFNKVLQTDSKLKKNIKALQNFVKQTQVETTIMLVPNSYDVLKDKQPLGLPNINQHEQLSHLKSEIDKVKRGVYLDVEETLKEHKDEYIYYHTDHHWTTLGAYYAYLEYCQKNGLEPMDKKRYKAMEVENFYGTYFAKYKGFDISPDMITYYEIPIKKMKIADKTFDTLYDLEKINKYDKYAMFLHGNNALSTIESEMTEYNKNQKLLILKDSYANSLIPYLTYNYDTIYVVDLRYYKGSVKDLIEKNNINHILIEYNFDTFMSDNHFFKLTK